MWKSYNNQANKTKTKPYQHKSVQKRYSPQPAASSEQEKTQTSVRHRNSKHSLPLPKNRPLNQFSSLDMFITRLAIINLITHGLGLSLRKNITTQDIRGEIGVTSAWSPLGGFLEGQEHPDRRIFKDLWICAFYL